MTWTYSGLPGDSTLDKLRFLIGQTSTSDVVLLSDEEITWASDNTPGVYYAAALCAENLQIQYAKKADDLTVGQTRVSYASRAKEFGQAAVRFRQQALFAGVSPYAGGVSVSDKDTREDDSDTVFPFATIKDMDNTGVSTT